MAGRRISKIRKTRPVYFVFCEGESENAYINLLRSHFRFPIEIKSKVIGEYSGQRGPLNPVQKGPVITVERGPLYMVDFAC
jgi:hypothetical protein